MFKVLIADDEPLFMEGIKRIIESDDELKVIGLVENGREAVHFCREIKPDIILMDIKMPVMDGIEATRQIKQYDGNIKILILTTFSENGFIDKAVENRCDGYILKEIGDIEKFNSTIKNTCKGLKIMDEDVFNKLVYKHTSNWKSNKDEQVPSLEGSDLTERELEVVKLITQGRKNSEIAGEIFTTEGVVKNMISKILEKLYLRNCKELAVWGARHGL